MEGNKALAALRGGHLDTVSFVMDYVEFRIDDNVRLIDTTVVSAAEVEGRIEVRTHAGHVLAIPLTGDAGGPEFAHLVPAGGGILVW